MRRRNNDDISVKPVAAVVLDPPSRADARDAGRALAPMLD
jgi:hypothetical protein